MNGPNQPIPVAFPNPALMLRMGAAVQRVVDSWILAHVEHVEREADEAGPIYDEAVVYCGRGELADALTELADVDAELRELFARLQGPGRS